MQKASLPTDRTASGWYNAASFSVDLNFTDQQTHQVAVYALDWDKGNRNERVDILDAASNAVLDSRTVSGFSGGQYLIWRVSGHIQIRVTATAGPNAVVSGILFDNP